MTETSGKPGAGELTLAVRFGRFDEALALLERGADPNERGAGGYTPLMWATSECYPKMARMLIAWGARVDERDNGGYTALMDAAAMGLVENARVLLENGADFTLQNNKGDTAESLAQEKKNAGVKLFSDARQQHAAETAAHKAAMAAKLAAVKEKAAQKSKLRIAS